MELANVPGLDQWAGLKALALNSVTSPHSRRAYSTALDGFLGWYMGREQYGLTTASVNAFRANLESSGLARATVNLRLSAVRKLATEAADNGVLPAEIAAGVAHVKGLPARGDSLASLGANRLD
ncbi:MAG: site-specific integrase [Bryobacteraceae bacterium]